MTTKILTTNDCKNHIESIAQWIAPAMKHSTGESTLEDILAKLLSGQALCWMWTDNEDKPITLAVTEVIQYGRKKVCHLITTTGDWRAAHEGHDIIEDYANSIGCDSIMVWGRAGWSRVLTQFNFDSGRKYEQSYVVFEMKLGDKNEDSKEI